MKSILSGITCLLLLSGTNAQYYYKDLVVPRQAGIQIQKYREQKIKAVKLNSYESDGQPTENFQGSQEVDQNFTRITTNLKSAISGSSQLISNFTPGGLLTKTLDSTDGSSSTTAYTYNGKGELSSMVNISVSAGSHQEKEEHIWNFKNGQPESMFRIKNETDTTYIQFVRDDKGYVTEENSIRKGASLPSYYYYYDDTYRLTDIVSYNIKAKRLLPDYIFEYNQDGLYKTLMVIPEGSSDYQKWYYEYNNGLKTTETVFNKKKQLLGKIEYHYD
jgi:YD repeat-containing protein